MFTPGMRKYFAAHNINDPLSGIESYVDGDIKAAGSYCFGVSIGSELTVIN